MDTSPTHPLRRRRPVAALLALLALVATACGAGDGAPADAPAPGQPSIVATTTILADLVAQLVDDRAEVDALLEPGQDPHGWAPSARDVQRVRDADLVVAIGAGLEAGLEDVLAQAEADGVRVLRVAPELQLLPFSGESLDAHADDDHGDEHGEDHGDEHDEEGDEGHALDDGHGHDALDPHVWLDPIRWADAIDVVVDALVATGVEAPGDDWTAVAAALRTEFLGVHDEVEATLAPVPQECRVLVTNHDAYGYFAARYGFEVVGVVVPGASAEAQPSAKEFAELAAVVRDRGVPAVFADTTQSTRLAESLAAEVGREVRVVPLATDALDGEGSWQGIMRGNATAVADALGSC